MLSYAWWSDKTRYHHALVAWYGLLELLRKQGTLKHKSVKFANYSNDTYTAENLDDAKRLALKPQFGGTSLDLDKVRDMFGRGQLVFTISDGDMNNWYKIREEFIERAKQNHYFHFQIGGKTQMTADLEAAGIHVEYDDGSTLGTKIIDLTKPYISKKNGNR